MDDRPLDEQYFDWLHHQVGSGPEKDCNRTYVKMLERLFFKEFVWFIANDDNRAEDGKDLRREFLGNRQVSEDWMWIGCSLLELLVALSRRLAFEADGEPRFWFWQMLSNAGLLIFYDNRGVPKEAIDEALDRIIWRTYDADGRGGLFPLQYPSQDQREVEIWYQMSAYLLERVP